MRITILLGFALAGAVGAEEPAALDFSIVFAQETTGGAPASRIVLRTPDGSWRILTDGFVAAADPCVSFDGERLLFAGKPDTEAPWDIWEMKVDGSEKTRITRDLGDCREPIYLPRAGVDAPNFAAKVRWITFTSTAPGVLNDQGDGALTSLHAVSLEPVPGRGAVIWRTTHNLGGDVSPTLLSDGRVLFSARQRGAFALMTISWAGENLNPFYGSHDGFVSQLGATELPDRTVVFVESETAARDAGGRLARISLRRPLHSHEVLTEEAGGYRTPHGLPDGRILVSYSDGGSYALHLFDPASGRGPRVFDDPEWDDVDAVPVLPRAVPPGRIPTVEFASVLDVGSLRAVGQLQCLNVYDSDRPGAEEIEPGRVRTVRFVEGRPRPVPAGWASGSPPFADVVADSSWPPPNVGTRTLGEAPVETDGSFYVNVAADVPFYLETLDAGGDVVQTMRAWMWVRAGDQRGCVGCHEDKELAPENRATMALIRADPKTLLPSPEAGSSVAGSRGASP